MLRRWSFRFGKSVREIIVFEFVSLRTTLSYGSAPYESRASKAVRAEIPAGQMVIGEQAPQHLVEIFGGNRYAEPSLRI